MSKENVQKFYELLQHDPAVAEELKQAGNNIDSAEKAIAAVIGFAQSKGFDFTAEEIAEFEQESQRELSLDELDNINAGAWGICFVGGGGKGGTATGLGCTDCDGFGWGFGISWSEFDQEAANREYKDKKINPLADNNSQFGVR